MHPLQLTRHSRILAAVLLVAILPIEFGGYYLTEIVRGDQEATEFQVAFARAGHAHAGVLVTLGLVGLVLADATRLRGLPGYLARHGVPVAALLMSAGFFLSSAESGATAPNGLIVLVWLGALSLAAGVLTLAYGLVSAPGRSPGMPELVATTTAGPGGGGVANLGEGGASQATTGAGADVR